MVELGEIFREHGAAFRTSRNLSPQVLKVMRAIETCRTAALGSHADVCEDCGNTRISYNSCRNRHCPKCQRLTQEKWVENRKADLLNIPYFHVVFTVPDELRQVIYQNQRKLYALLFRCASESILELSGNPKFLGAKTGLTAILHTWGQTLTFHPHIHCIVPGGGLDSLGNWQQSRKKFFLPVRVLSKLFCGKFLHHLQTIKLDFVGHLNYLENPADFMRLIHSCYKKQWVTYCKPPFGNAAQVVRYLGRYTHRVAISNHRILTLRDGKVTFQWKDYRDEGKCKVMTLAAHEFIRRFLLHVLPYRFMKIRHFGILANRGKEMRITLCKLLTKTPILPKQTLSMSALILQTIGIDITRCPACGSANLTKRPFLTNSS